MPSVVNKVLVPVVFVVVLAIAVVGVVYAVRFIAQSGPPVKPRVMIFGASWCGACPTKAGIQKLADDFPNVEVIHYDVDKHPEIVAKYRIRTLPTIIICSPKGCKVFHSMSAVRAYLTHAA